MRLVARFQPIHATSALGHLLIFWHRPMAPRIFISYRREFNISEAQHLATIIAMIFGDAAPFLDVRNIEAFDNWQETIHREIDTCSIMLCLIDEQWATAKNKRGELRLFDPEDPVACEIDRALRNCTPILPVFVDGASMPGVVNLPDRLHDLRMQQGLPLRKKHFTADAAIIVDAIRRRLPEQVIPHRRPRQIVRVGLISTLGVAIIGGAVLGLLKFKQRHEQQESYRLVQVVNPELHRISPGQKPIHVATLNFLDASRKAPLNVADAEILSVAINSALLSVGNTYPRVKIDTASLPNSDENISKLSAIYWDEHTDRNEKEKIIVDTFMRNKPLDILIFGLVVQREDGTVSIRPLGLSKNGRSYTTTSLNFARSEYRCVVRGMVRSGLCEKAAEMIRDSIQHLTITSSNIELAARRPD